MTRRKSPIDESKLEDWRGFYKELNEEKSDRAVAIVGAAFLDEHLGQVIANFLVDDEEAVNQLLNPDVAYAPFGSFGARIKGAYCLGLISQDERDELRTIKDIRNSFAHGLHGLSFDDQKIQAKCKKLKLPDEVLAQSSPQSPRDQFVVALSLLLSLMSMRALKAKKQRRLLAREFRVSQRILAGSDSDTAGTAAAGGIQAAVAGDRGDRAGLGE